MSSILTPKRREKAKRKARSSVQSRSTLSPKNKKASSYQAMTDFDDDDSNNSNNNMQQQPRMVTPTFSSSTTRRGKSVQKQQQQPRQGSDLNQTVSTDDYDEDDHNDVNRSTDANANGYNNNEQQQQQQQQQHVESNYYSFDEEMPMDEMMGTKEQEKKEQQQQQQHNEHHYRNTNYGSSSPTKSAVAVSSSSNNLGKDHSLDEHSVATYGSMAPTKEVSDVLGLSSIMSMASPLNWDTSNNKSQNSNNNNNNSTQGNESTSNSFLSSTSKPTTAPTTAPTPDGEFGGGSGIERMIAALNSGTTARRPLNLNREERILWDSLQTAMINDRNEHLSKRRSLEIDLQKSTNLLDEISVREMDLEQEVSQAKNDRSDIEHKYTAMSIVVEKLQSRKDKKKSYIRAIQRVLADINTEKMDLQEALEQAAEATDTVVPAAVGAATAAEAAVERKVEELVNEKDNDDKVDIASISNEDDINKLKDTLNKVEKEYQVVKLDAKKKVGRIVVLESDLKAARVKVSDIIEENKTLIGQIESDNSEIENLEYELENLKSVISENGTKIEELEVEISHQRKEGEKEDIETAHSAALVEIEQLKSEGEHREQEFEKLKSAEREPAIDDEVENLKTERDHAIDEMENLKKERDHAVNEVENLKNAREQAVNEVEKLKKAREHAVIEVEKAIMEAKAAKAEHITTIDTSDSSDQENDDSQRGIDQDYMDGVETEKELTSVNAEEVQNLQKTLSETTSSLENAKKIIASLENANGSLALDSRSKLKDKEEELSSVQKESEDRKRLLDSLATELRDLQRYQGDIDDSDRRTRAQVMKQKALMGHLETSLSDLQAAVVVHEASLAMMDSAGIADNSNIEEISEILGDTLHAISATLETTEHYVDDFGDENSAAVSDVDINSEVGRHIDSIIRNDREAASQGFKHELDQKKIAVKRLEEALKKQNDEMKKLRSLLEARGRGNYDNNHQLRAEIESLRQQCSTNMEVLAKKERELSVLRSSLKVDDGESGYISDDASDDDDDDDGTEVGSTMSATKLNVYGPADAEAYATILAQTSGRIEMPGRAQQENESLKRDLMEALVEKESASKELQARRESLANAKMIISSLEKANKGMMEDLRSRLQDSNAAIASLLDKSTEHEEAADTLREQLQKLGQEKLEERQKYEAKMRKLITISTRSDGEKECPLKDKEEDVSIFKSAT
ncbi:hypothetical protein FRACYDRAFT_234979 [Fragilariopsis cylindrus CCMP1102]|uniref:Uncharacterized protein n=1 Tax=Fragilariopsis cylindrus CCMP1102 TaxID=635003 RepID=A0A1E7FTA8_9STRA|nr:hypothetical protein FRACYDRAFT_234979 [Fragilariopsis cylindrus CCMP1102]|eukprot:OEU21354.1 hypothetical protein FRACYDRAFT_234979 [Fragilariopsis cylindrus CCMP1102]